MRSSRRLPALIGAAALVTAALAGCTAASGSACDPVYASGPSSSLVTASGSTVDFPTPMNVKKPQVTVLESGDGAVVPKGAQVDYTFSRYYGKDGQDLTGSSNTDRKEAGISGDAVSQALVCAHVGDKLALVSTVKQAYGAGSGGDITDDEAVVVVIDVTAAYLGKADGFNQLPQDGMPFVSTDVDGTPGLSVQLQTIPTVAKHSVIKSGDGVKVKKGDVLVAQMRFFVWPATEGDAPSIASSQSGQLDTWVQHRATNLNVKTTADGGGLPQEMYDAIVGQRIGSQVLVVLPAGADGAFPTGGSPTGTDDTFVVVLDLLGIQK